MSATTTTIQILSIASALVASGGIVTVSVFDMPLLTALPASHSLPLTRWLFSRGSHIFPSAAFVSAAGFSYLSWNALPATTTLAEAARHALFSGGKSPLYLAAAALTFGIGPFTQLVMLPTNLRLIELNEQKGGARSAASKKYRDEQGMGARSAAESVDSKEDLNQYRDLSGPMAKLGRETTAEEDEEVRLLLEKFAKLNYGRALLSGLGGVVGLVAAII